jgi:hypothetical protein
MGGKDSGPSQQSITQTNLPEYARPYFERLMARAEGVSNEPYALYPGPRIAGFNPDQETSFGMARGLSGLYQPGQEQAQGLIGQGSQELLQASPYQAGQFQGDFTPSEFNVGTVTPQMFIDSGVSEQYMSPYISQVLDAQRDRLARDFAEQNVARQGAAARAGGFGGGRHGVSEGIAERGYLQQTGDIYRTGLQSAFENAQQQFERDRAARMGAEQFNIEQGLRGQELADVSRRGLLGQELQAFGMNEEARQRAAQLAETRAQTLGGLGGLLSDVNQQGLAGNLDILDAMRQTGLQQQQREQASLDLSYEDFINQRDFDRQNLNFLSSILRGVPVNANANVSTYENVNPYSQMLGLGLNAYALSQALGQGGGGG